MSSDMFYDHKLKRWVRKMKCYDVVGCGTCPKNVTCSLLSKDARTRYMVAKDLV